MGSRTSNVFDVDGFFTNIKWPLFHRAIHWWLSPISSVFCLFVSLLHCLRVLSWFFVSLLPSSLNLLLCIRFVSLFPLPPNLLRVLLCVSSQFVSESLPFSCFHISFSFVSKSLPVSVVLVSSSSSCLRIFYLLLILCFCFTCFRISLVAFVS